MLQMLRDLIAHKGHANAALLTAIRQNPTAAAGRAVQDRTGPTLSDKIRDGHGRRKF